MFPGLKSTLVPLVAVAFIIGSAVALQTPRAEADVDEEVWFLDSYTPSGAATCDAGEDRLVRVFDPDDPDNIDSSILPAPEGEQDPVVQISADDDLIICVMAEDIDGPVVFNSSGDAEWSNARCGTLDNPCLNEDGVGTDDMTVPGDVNPFPLIAVTFSCDSAGVKAVSILQDDADAGDGDEFNFLIMCKGEADNIQLTATPSTVESHPALYNVSHSLIRAVITDSAGNPVAPGTDAEVTSTCSVSTEEVDTLDERAEALFNAGDEVHDGLNLNTINAEFGPPPLQNFIDIQDFSDRPSTITATDTDDGVLLEVDTNAFPDDPDGGDGDGVPNHSELLLIFHAEGCDPGVHTVTIDVDGEEASVDITVIGPPAFITVTAAPTELVCGEKSEITIAVTDALNQQVSDNTWVEVVTNLGGVLAGTGTSLTTTQPVNPISSTTVEIFDGLGIAYLLTSPAHVGPYEVLAASTLPPLGGLDDAPRVTAQATVTCTLGSTTPDVTAPDTGTGTIRPPNTGSGGLAGGGSGTLAVIAGVALMAFAAIARSRVTGS